MITRILTPKRWGLCLIAVAIFCLGCEELMAVPAGCDSMLPQGQCELGKDRQLRLFVPTARSAQVYVLRGRRRLPLTATAVDGGLLLRVAVGQEVGDLRVIARDGWKLFSQVVPVRESRTEVWLQEARRLWESDQVAAAESLLERRLHTPLALRTRAEALGILGRIRSEQHKVADAQALLTQALQADEESGLVSNAGKDVLKLAAMLVQDENKVQAAEAFLTSKGALFQQTPDLQPWFYLQLATYRKTRGELQDALAAVEEGRQLAARLGEEQALGSLRQAATTILEALGRWEEARAEIVGLPDELGGEPCRQANALEMQGWLELVGRETRQKGAESHDPQIPLLKALRLRREHCHQIKPIASTLTLLSRAALFMGQPAQAQTLLAEAQSLMPAEDFGLREQWTEIRGLIALRQRDFRTAETRFRELLRLGQSNPDTPGAVHSGINDLNDTIWRARIGLAHALMQSARPEEAKQQFQLAEQFLDRRSVEVSLAEGRVSYLGKHEQGTAAYLQLLYASGRVADALTLIRKARARGLRTLLRLASISRLDDAQRQRWEEALGRYRELRRKLDDNALHLDSPAFREEQIYSAERRRLELELAAVLDAGLAVLSEPPEQPLRAPAAEEALLACHPLPQGWLCLLARGAEPVLALPLPQGFDGAGAALFAPAGELLRGAARMTVLSYGTEMEQFDFARAPLRGRPVEQELPVVYGLDLAPAAAPAVSSKQVLLAIDPVSDFSEERRPLLQTALLKAADWKATALPSEQGLATEHLLSMLGEHDSPELFIYFGHAQAAAQMSRRFLKTATVGGLQATDVLTLKSVPREVLLIACESGVAKEGSGGVAGLGLAQAFLLRGSQAVIATTRKVPPLLGKAMTEELTRAGLTELVNSPVARLRAARQAVETGVGRDRPWGRDTSAFRVFVP